MHIFAIIIKSWNSWRSNHKIQNPHIKIMSFQYTSILIIFCDQNASIFCIFYFIKFLFYFIFSIYFIFSPFKFIFSFFSHFFLLLFITISFFFYFLIFLSSSFFHWACKFYAQHLGIAQTIQKNQPRCNHINLYTSNYT